jgi:hypothetical protein
MKPIKDIISNLFSTNKKKDEGVSLEIESEPETKEDAEHKTDIKDESKSTKDEEHEAEFKKERNIQKNEDIADDSEWEKRVLCSDGNCIGIIDSDGHCKECGKSYNNDLEQIDDPNDNIQKSEALQADKELISDEQEIFSKNHEEFINTSDDSNTEDSESDMKWELESDSEWDNRTLCSDGNCIGVIGPDGRCKECGNPYDE